MRFLLPCVCLWLALLMGGLVAEAAPPERTSFVFGVYDKFGNDEGRYGEDFSFEQWKEHYARLLDLLAQHHINALLTQPFHDARRATTLFDIAHQRGVRIIMGTGNPLNPNWDQAGEGSPFHAAYTHPAVVAIKYGDEPKDQDALRIVMNQTAGLRRHYDAPVLTCMIGEAFGSDDSSHGSQAHTAQAWAALKPRIKFLRYYPYRETGGLVDWNRKRLVVAPKTAFGLFEQTYESADWWYVAQTFGKRKELSQDAYWRYPTAAELSALVHLALANGARGVLGYTLQSEGENWPALVTQDLEPIAARDGSIPLEAFSRLAAMTNEHAALLSRHERADFSLTSQNPAVEAVARRDPEAGDSYVYLVNMDAESHQIATVVVNTGQPINTSTDMYSDREVPVLTKPTGAEIRLFLGPGVGALIRLD